MPIQLPDLSKIPKKQIAILGGGVLVVIVLIIIIMANLQGEPAGPGTADARLTVWGPLGDFEGKYLTDSYAAIEPMVDIQYRSIDRADYEQTLLDALAAGEGPDIFMVNNRSLPMQAAKLSPLSLEAFPMTSFRELFPAVAEQDFVSDNRVYALPLFIDTLALFYNQELFDQVAIVAPPRTWEEFQNIVPSLRSLNSQGQIVKAAAAIGGSKRSIATASDIVALLMLERGVPIVGTRGVKFEQRDGDGAGFKAFSYYLQFANPASPLYTWNDNFGNYIDSFASGKTAMIFDYRDRISAIQEKAPFLRVGVAPMPQIASDAAVNYADYWGFGVSKQSKFSNEAWKFIINTAANKQVAQAYMKEFRRPPALRALIGAVANDPELGIFAKQALTARSWKQPNSESVQDIFSGAIARALTGQVAPQAAFNELGDQLEQLLAKKN